MSGLQLQVLESKDFARWDAFVAAHPEGTFFHRAGWKTVLEKTFGHRCYFYYMTQGDEIVAVLPLVYINSFLFGKSLASIPFCPYAGVIGEADACTALEQAALQLAQQLKVGALEYRNQNAVHADWPNKDLYVNFAKTLDADNDVNLAAIPRKQRAVIRKSLNNDLEPRFNNHVDDFYHVFSESYRNLGTPIFTKKLFANLLQVFGKDCDILMIYHQDKPVTGVMNFYFKDRVMPYYGGGIADSRHLKSYDFMYWHLMCEAVQRGYQVFDFGRSKQDTGSYSFKKNWGFEAQSLSYEYVLVEDSDIPNLSPTNPKYQMFIKAWRKLPVSISQLVGPWLAKDLG